MDHQIACASRPLATLPLALTIGTAASGYLLFNDLSFYAPPEHPWPGNSASRATGARWSLPGRALLGRCTA